MNNKVIDLTQKFEAIAGLFLVFYGTEDGQCSIHNEIRQSKDQSKALEIFQLEEEKSLL